MENASDLWRSRKSEQVTIQRQTEQIAPKAGVGGDGEVLLRKLAYRGCRCLWQSVGGRQQQAQAIGRPFACWDKAPECQETGMEGGSGSHYSQPFEPL